MNKFKIKVCGMRNPQNILELSTLPIDIIGYIFYSKSKRYVGENFSPTTHASLPLNIARAGVFVNDTIANICKMQQKHSLAFIQLHGDESVDFCTSLQNTCSKPIIKAFQISDDFDFSITKSYASVCNYFLFDTKTKNYGGSGQTFNWSILKKYTGNTPFFLSGGIDSFHANEIRTFKHPKLYAIDINSKFELAPAVKDVNKIANFVTEIKKNRK